MATLKDSVVSGSLRVTDTLLADKIAINGMEIFRGVCATPAATTQKDVVCPSFTSADLVIGTAIFVTFTVTNSGAVASLTMSVNGTTAKPIKCFFNASIANLPAVGYLLANATYLFVYDGTNWVYNGANRDTTSTVNQNAVIADSDTNKYTILHAQNTGTSARNGYAVYKSKVTYQPSTQNLFIQDKPVLFGEYTDSSAPASPVAGQLWLKQSSMNIEEAKVLVVSVTSGTLPTTITNSNITADMEVIKSEVSNPQYQGSDLTVTTAAGSATISGTLTASITIKLWLMRGR